MVSLLRFCPGEEASPEGRYLKTQHHGQTPVGTTAWPGGDLAPKVLPPINGITCISLWGLHGPAAGTGLPE